MFLTAVYVKYLLLFEVLTTVFVFFILMKEKKESIFHYTCQLFKLFICYDIICDLLLTLNYLQRNEFSKNIIELTKSYQLDFSYYTSSALVLIILIILYFINYYIKLNKLCGMHIQFKYGELKKRKSAIDDGLRKGIINSEIADKNKDEIISMNDSLNDLYNFEISFEELVKIKIDTTIMCILANFLFGIAIGMDFYSETFMTALTNSSYFSFISGIYFSISLLPILFMYQMVVKSVKQKYEQLNNNNDSIKKENNIERNLFYSDFTNILDFYSHKKVNFYKELNDLLEKIQADKNQEFPEKFIKETVKSAELNNLERVIDDIVSNMVLCQSGEFLMGSPEDEIGRQANEKQHSVKITKNFYLNRFVVTNWHYRTVINNIYDLKLNELDNPITGVDWFEAKEFCKILNNKFSNKIPKGYKFDLPTEAQWEYACRAGIAKAFNNGTELTDNIEKSDNLDEICWYNSLYGDWTKPVGDKKPNSWGLYDLHGNVWEWCNDWYGDYKLEEEIDPTGNNEGTYKIIRGGCVKSLACDCRSAKRNYEEPDVKDKYIGFRLALVPLE